MAAIGPGERVAAASGALLLLLMLFDWFEGASAWQLRRTDLLLFAIGVLAIGFAAARLVDPQLVPRQAAGLALVVAGAVGLGVMLTLVIESTGGTVPLVLSLFATGGILAGGLVSRSGRSGGSAGPGGRPAGRPRHAPVERESPAP